MDANAPMSVSPTVRVATSRRGADREGRGRVVRRPAKSARPAAASAAAEAGLLRHASGMPLWGCAPLPLDVFAVHEQSGKRGEVGRVLMFLRDDLRQLCASRCK